AYFRAQGMFGMPRAGDCDYSDVIEIDLTAIEPSVAGPKRPQDRIAVSQLKKTFNAILEKPVTEGGYGRLADRTVHGGVPTPPSGVLTSTRPAEIADGAIVLAAITSCTNTSNPSVLLAAGLLARNAVQRGLTVSPSIKTSFAPGSRVVTDYLERAGLQEYLDLL